MTSVATDPATPAASTNTLDNINTTFATAVSDGQTKITQTLTTLKDNPNDTAALFDLQIAMAKQQMLITIATASIDSVKKNCESITQRM